MSALLRRISNGFHWKRGCYANGMGRLVVWLVLAIPGFLCGTVVPPPQRGFEQNLGQYAGDVLFGLDDTLLYQNRLQVSKGFSIQFTGASPSAAVTGSKAGTFPLNLYLGADRSRWLRNVPNYMIVGYSQIYSGIEVDCNVGVPPTNIPGFRIIVSPGANPKQLMLTLLTADPLTWSVFPNEIFAGPFTLTNLVAYQIAGNSKSAVQVGFVQLTNDSFRPEVAAYDATLPLVIEFGDPFGSSLVQQNLHVTDDDFVITSGFVFAGTPRRSFLAKSRLDGTPVFLTLFDWVFGRGLASDQNGNITAAGVFGAKVLYTPSAPPVTVDAPDSEAQTDSDGWLGHFDSNGNLLSGTYTGGPVSGLALDPAGSVYISTPNTVLKWVPGTPQFPFAAPISNVLALATNPSGQLAFAATGTAGLPTTSGAVKTSYEGQWTEYVGTLEPSSGAIQMATYAAVTGRTTETLDIQTSLALAPDGTLWLASEVTFYYPIAATLRPLVAVSGDGSRIVDSENLRFVPNIAFESSGNVLLAATTKYPNLPTSLDAPVRVPCLENALYLVKKAPDGSFLSATYANATGQVLAFTGFDRLFISSNPTEFPDFIDISQVDSSPPAAARISCVISPATKRSLYAIAPGELTTISGTRLGPLETVNAAPGADGSLPAQLAGVQVLVNGAAMPLVSVQQGEITFYVPTDTPVGPFQLEVQSAGVEVASTSIHVDDAPRFAILTADGSGFGAAAALNQDGTRNWVQAAPPGSVVQLFGIGTTPPTSAMLANVPASVEYAGPAPRLALGVKQINLRMPAAPSYNLTNGFAPIVFSPGPPEFGTLLPPVFIKLSQ